MPTFAAVRPPVDAKREALLPARSKRHYHPRMDDVGLRIGLVVRGLVPFVFMMASLYLATHILFARLITTPTSQVLAFFTIVTAPLTRPIRTLLPAGINEARVRVIALAIYVALWIVTDWVMRLVVPIVRG